MLFSGFKKKKHLISFMKDTLEGLKVNGCYSKAFLTFMSIPPTNRALGVNLPSGKMYPFDSLKECKVWLALLDLLISLQLQQKINKYNFKISFIRGKKCYKNPGLR